MREARGLLVASIRRSIPSACVPALLAAGSAFLSGCSVDVDDEEAVRSTEQSVVGSDQFLYLRCNSTDWNVTEKSRLQATATANFFSLTIQVTQSWTLSDQCSFTLVAASQPDSWGTGQSSYTDSKPSSVLEVPGGDTMAGPSSAQTNFSVQYPKLGTYVATVDWSAKRFTIAVAGQSADASADAPADHAGDPGDANDARSVDAADAAADRAVDASDASADRPVNGSDAAFDASDASADRAADAASDRSEAGEDAAKPADASVEGSSYVPPTGGYTVQCPWLLDTSMMVDHLRSSANFYVNVADAQFGGFFTYLDQKGNPKSTNKSFTVQSRDAFAFAHAFMVTGDETYLTAARQALDFLYAHAWDADHGGFVFLGDQQGNWLPAPSGVPSDKWSFTQHYALAGPTAMCEATESTTDCDMMNTGMQLLEQHYWDTADDGYFNNANLDFSSVWEKGFTPTIDGITPHVLLSYLVTQNAAYKTRFISLADDARVHLVGNMTAPGVVFGYPEFFNSDWSIETGNTYGFVGHLYKTGWALARAYLVTGDARYRTAARQLLMQLWNDGGFDHTNGAPNFDYNFNSGVGSTNKEYWQLEQGFTSGITSYYIATTDADRAIDIEQADRSLCFFMKHLPDAQFGGIFFETNADGSALVGDGTDAPTDKGDQWEGSYHNAELSYYTYLYGNLLFWRRPVTLYYRFDVSPLDRTIPLNPLEIESGGLLVTGVSLAGKPYTDFDGAARTLHVPPSTGGIFAVTYAHAP